MQTTFQHVGNDDEFIVKTTAGSELHLHKVSSPILATDRPGYKPMFVIPGQNTNPTCYNAMGRFGGRWEYFYLYDSCPVTVIVKAAHAA